MLVKPLNLIIVYILTIINFIILLMPFTAIIILLMNIDQEFVLAKMGQVNFIFLLNLFIFIISFLMIFYLFLDFIFGFSLRSSMKGCTKYEKIKEYEFLEALMEQIHKAFGRKDVRLYIDKSMEINAFAVGSLGKKIIVLTQGLITHTLNNSKDRREFLFNLRSIMGHEMSHLINKDYLPALLIIVNEKVTHLISRLLELTLKIPLTILGYVRVRSRILFDIVMFIYSTVNRIFTAFNEKVVFNLYEFIRRFISRSIEYRCDRQAAQAFGGHNMAVALSLFGDNGYFTLFSTHPNTNKRIERVKNLTRKGKIIRPLISSSISNYLALLFLVIVCASTAKASEIDLVTRSYLAENHEMIFAKISFLFQEFKKILILGKQFLPEEISKYIPTL